VSSVGSFFSKIKDTSAPPLRKPKTPKFYSWLHSCVANLFM